MAEFDYGSYAVADSYARSLLELSEEAGASDEALAEFGELVSLMERDADFGGFMTSPAVDTDTRRDVLEKHFRGKLSDLLLNTLQVINRKDRAELIPLVYERYRLALEQVRNEVDVYVTAAVELSGALRKAIRHAASKITGKTARLVEKVDPGILGGLVVQIGDEKMDSSVLRQLQQIRRTLHERASQEIHSGKEYVESASS
jgi:F-type H+-transporting ATPase subunit delta